MSWLSPTSQRGGASGVMRAACSALAAICSGRRSMPVYRRPSREATMPRTEPPANGSSTAPAGGQNHV
jgi:hypothetical protein